MEYSDLVKERARSIADSINLEMLKNGIVTTAVYDHCLPTIEDHVADLMAKGRNAEASDQRRRRSRLLDLVFISAIALLVLKWIFS